MARALSPLEAATETRAAVARALSPLETATETRAAKAASAGLTGNVTVNPALDGAGRLDRPGRPDGPDRLAACRGAPGRTAWRPPGGAGPGRLAAAGVRTP